MGNENLTPQEELIETVDGVDCEEAHRVGEFDDLVERLERIESTLTRIDSAIGDMQTRAASIDIDNGADVVDVDGDGDADIIDDDIAVIPDYEDLDLDL